MKKVRQSQSVMILLILSNNAYALRSTQQWTQSRLKVMRNNRILDIACESCEILSSLTRTQPYLSWLLGVLQLLMLCKYMFSHIQLI